MLKAIKERIHKVFPANNIRDNQLIVLFTALIIFILTFEMPVFSFGTGLDQSWVFGINYFFANNYVYGKDIIFTYGPLGFLLTIVPIGNNMLLGLIFWSGIQFIFAIITYFYISMIHEESKLGPRLVVLILTLLFINKIDTSYILVFGALISSLLYGNSKKPQFYVLAVFLAALAFLIKFGMGIMAGSFIFWGLIGMNNEQGKSFRGILKFIASISISLIIILFIIEGELSGLPDYLRGSFEFARGFSSAMALGSKNRWGYFITGIFTIFTAQYFLVPKSKKFVVINSILPTFIWYKYTFARDDHVTGFMEYLIVLFLFLLLHSRDLKKLALNILLIIIMLNLIWKTFDNYPYFHVKMYSVNDSFKKCYKFSGLSNIKNDVLNFNKKKYLLKAKTALNTEKKKLDPIILSKLNNHSIDFFPFELTYAYANSIRWRPRKIIQSYAAYTSWLDQQNSNIFKENKGPDYLIIDNMQTIDKRYLLNDIPLTIFEIFNHYKPVVLNKGALLFQKTNYNILKKPEFINRKMIDWNQWVGLPPHKGGILRGRLSFTRTFKGLMKRATYKESPIFICYRFKDGSVKKHRIIPDNATNGAWLDPYLIIPRKDNAQLLEKNVQACDYENNKPKLLSVFLLHQKRVMQIKFVCRHKRDAKKYFENKIEIQFEVINMDPADMENARLAAKRLLQ